MIEFLTIVLIGLIVVFLSEFIRINFFGKKNLAPGPIRFPFIGSLIQVAWENPTEPHVAFKKLGEKYGNIMSIQLGSVYTVVLNSFELMEEYLTKTEFSDRYFNDWMAERTFQKRLGVIVAQFPNPWHQLRRFSLRSLKDFGFGKRSKMHTNIQAELSDIVKDLQASVKENNGIVTFDGYFTISFLNLVWSMLAGQRYEHTDEKLLRLVKVAKELFLSCSLGNSFLLVFPEWKDWFPNWTGMSFQRRCYKEMNPFFQDFIEERKNLGAYKTNPENFVDEFLREIEQQNENNGELTEQQLVALMSDFFFAGSETSSHTLAWCILYILLNPSVQVKLQEEIDSTLSKGSFSDAEHASQLHYVRATLAETHRMASVFPLMVPRAATENTYCANYFIPKGTYVMTNIYAMHHNKSYWKDPENFRPERFLDENGKFKGDPRLKPFGFGKRSCLGESLASMSLIHYLTVLLQNFSFHQVPNEPPPTVNPVVGVTSGPQIYRASVKCR